MLSSQTQEVKLNFDLDFIQASDSENEESGYETGETESEGNDEVDQLPVEQEEPEKKPEKRSRQACTYCGVFHPDAVVRCLTCKQWFCNRNTHNFSHILFHLARSKHNSIAFHQNSSIGGNTELFCYQCENSNVFSLGSVPSHKRGVSLILCRNCANNGMAGYDTSTWAPLVEGRRSIVAWLVRPPTVKEKLDARRVTYEELEEFEGRSRKRVATSANFQPESVKKIYETPARYNEIFSDLVDLEKFEDKERCNVEFNKVKVDWIHGISHDYAVFELDYDLYNFNIKENDLLRLSLKGDKKNDYTSVGRVVSVWQKIKLEMAGTNNPLNNSLGFTVSPEWNPTPYLRRIRALERFSTKFMSEFIYATILGNIPLDIKEDWGGKNDEFVFQNPPSIPPLNRFQIIAVENAIKNKIALIQGPPGTGKTVTSSTIVYNLVQMIKKHNIRGKVLVCSGSNAAVDQIANRCYQTKMKVIRVYAKSRERSDSSLLGDASLFSQVLAASPLLTGFEKLKQQFGELSKNDEKKFEDVKAQIEAKLIKESDVICCTCITAGSEILEKFDFPFVLIDEATQTAEPESLIPITKKCKHLILVGDHCQLGPTILSREAQKAGLGFSLFERLIVLGVEPSLLQIQYRMHPALSEFPSNHFYGGVLLNGITEEQRKIPGFAFNWPNKQKPFAFVAVDGNEELSASGVSYLNRAEALRVEKTIRVLLKAGIQLAQIGVVTPYVGQINHICEKLSRGALRNENLEELKVASIDSFQGSEKDFIIFSCVRANPFVKTIGFLNDKRRMNVALTRAKYGLIIFGHPRCLSSKSLWNDLLQFFSKNKALVEGNFPAVKQYDSKFLHKVEREPDAVPLDPNFNFATDDYYVYHGEFEEEEEEEEDVPKLPTESAAKDETDSFVIPTTSDFFSQTQEEMFSFPTKL